MIARWIALFLLLNIKAYTQQAPNKIEHKKPIIVLTYDDALTSQLQIAIPQLDSTNLTATFFLDGNILL